MSAKAFLLDALDFIDFELYGISSKFLDSVQFVFNLNTVFQTQFQRIEDLDILIDGQTTYYPMYEWEDVNSHTLYHIVKNLAYTTEINQKMSNLSSLFDVTPNLIKQYKEYNYFLKVSPELYGDLPIQENDFIQKITKLDTDNVKNIENLIF